MAERTMKINDVDIPERFVLSHMKESIIKANESLSILKEICLALSLKNGLGGNDKKSWEYICRKIKTEKKFTKKYSRKYLKKIYRDYLNENPHLELYMIVEKGEYPDKIINN